MAKKRAAGDFNMAKEIRALLSSNRNLTGKEVFLALVDKFSNQTLNEASCGVAFSNARKQLGISVGLEKRTVKKKIVKRKIAATKAAAPVAAVVDLPTLQAAAKFVSEIGSADRVIAAIKQLKTLQFD